MLWGYAVQPQDDREASKWQSVAMQASTQPKKRKPKRKRKRNRKKSQVMPGQFPLWQDGHTIMLDNRATRLGKTRARRFFEWIDEAGQDWRTPDLNAFRIFMIEEYHVKETTATEINNHIKEHYLRTLAEEDRYSYIPPKERAKLVNAIVQHFGMDVKAVGYRYITRYHANPSENFEVLFPSGYNWYAHQPLLTFINWLDDTGRCWNEPEMIYYKAHLRSMDIEYEVEKGIIGSLRRRYEELAEDEETLSEYLTPEEIEKFHRDLRKNLGFRDAYPSRTTPTREMLEDDPMTASYLTPDQVRELLIVPDDGSFIGLRDRALIAMALVGGLMQYEVCNIHYEDLRHEYEGEVALYVRESKSKPGRYIPYEDFYKALEFAELWCERAHITEGPIFRGTYGSYDSLRPTAIVTTTASDILARNPITMHGMAVPLVFGDLRATAARRWFENGHDFDEIERRLGILYRGTTFGLIGVKIREIF